MIKINDNVINKQEFLNLINNKQKIQAIKKLKETTNLGLKECKYIIDNLTMNPNYYDGQTISKPTITSLKDKNKLSQRTKGSHVLSSNSSNSKTYILLILIVIITVLLYMYFNK
ncbi:ribosomal protein L7/L12 [uncultured Winogradskyella sp.]|uniref:ribosomal protein L7/L12 n=1 Tax=Winogradskyella sp. 4-2091 TaxID=3381659 RepID=UPI00345B60EE